MTTLNLTLRPMAGEVFSPEAVAGLVGQRITITHPAVAGGSQTGTVTSARRTHDGVDLTIEPEDPS